VTNKPVALGLVIVVNFASAAHADSMTLRTTSGAEIGRQLSSYRYEEQVNSSFFMSNEGIKLGVTASLTQALPHNWYVMGDGRYAWGHVDYTGSGTKANNRDAILEARLSLGRDLEFGGYVLSPYIGLGIRNLNNDLRGMTSTGASGYRRESSYRYLPIGLTHRFHAGGDSRIATSLEYDYLIEGSQLSRLSDADSRYNDPRNTQRFGFGFRMSTSYETMRWSAGVFYHFWSLGDSERGTLTFNGVNIGGAIEPKNWTNELGVQVKYRFN
jgi:hypothetical protein